MRVALPQLLPVTEEQEDDVVGADAEEHDHQDRVEGGAHLEVEKVCRHGCHTTNSDEDHSDHDYGQDRDDGTAEHQPECEQDDDHRRNGDDLLGISVGGVAVNRYRGIARETRCEPGAFEVLGGIVAHIGHRIVDRLVTGLPGEGHLERGHLAVRRERLGTADDARDAGNLGVLQRCCQTQGGLLIIRREWGTVGTRYHQAAAGPRRGRKVLVTQLLSVDRFERRWQEVLLIVARAVLEVGREQDDHHGDDHPTGDEPPRMSDNCAGDDSEHGNFRPRVGHVHARSASRDLARVPSQDVARVEAGKAYRLTAGEGGESIA